MQNVNAKSISGTIFAANCSFDSSAIGRELKLHSITQNGTKIISGMPRSRCKSGMMMLGDRKSEIARFRWMSKLILLSSSSEWVARK